MMTGKKHDWCLVGFIWVFVVVVFHSTVEAQINKIELSIEEELSGERFSSRG